MFTTNQNIRLEQVGGAKDVVKYCPKRYCFQVGTVVNRDPEQYCDRTIKR